MTVDVMRTNNILRGQDLALAVVGGVSGGGYPRLLEDGSQGLDRLTRRRVGPGVVGRHGRSRGPHARSRYWAGREIARLDWRQG